MPPLRDLTNMWGPRGALGLTNTAAKPMPDSPEANRLGCSCPATGNGMPRGEGLMIEGIRSWTVSRNCPLHSKLEFWLTRRPR